MKQNKVACETW